MDLPPTRLLLIGYWRSDTAPDWPDPRRLVDPSWDAADRALVADYLDHGQRAPWASAGPSMCRLCGEPVGSMEFLDGTYLWPEGLGHYVREHSVRLPRAILDHIARWCEPERWAVDSEWWIRAASSATALAPPPASARPEEGRN